MLGFRSVYLKDICNFEKGAVGLAKAIPGEYPLVTTGAERRTCESFQFDTKAVCIPLVSSTGHGHASLKNVHYQEGEFALGTILVALTAIDDNELDTQFLHLYLSQLKDIILVPLMSGAANVALSVTKIKNVEIPLPSIERQQEIVSQFKSVVREEAELKSELTHQQTLLKKLRQQILQEAIEGKLTEKFRMKNKEQLRIWNDELRSATDPETIRHLKLKIRNCSESAASLLSRINAEKEQLIKDKKIKKQKALPAITDEEKLFDLPDGWAWSRLGELIEIKSGKRIHASDYRQEGTPFLRSGEISSLGRGEPLKNKLFIDTEQYKRIKEQFGIPKHQDILIACIGGSIGNTWVVDEREFYFKDGNIVWMVTIPQLNYRFLLSYLKSPFFWKNTILNATDSSYNALTIIKLNESFIALPPLSEQKVIVAKVEKLLAICDQLETQITSSQTHAEQLMQAVLKEAFQQNSNDELAGVEV